MFVGPLSPRHGASSGYELKTQPPDMDGTCKYTKEEVVDSLQGVVLQLQSWARA